MWNIWAQLSQVNEKRIWVTNGLQSTDLSHSFIHYLHSEILAPTASTKLMTAHQTGQMLQSNTKPCDHVITLAITVYRINCLTMKISLTRQVKQILKQWTLSLQITKLSAPFFVPSTSFYDTIPPGSPHLARITSSQSPPSLSPSILSLSLMVSWKTCTMLDLEADYPSSSKAFYKTDTFK